MATTSSILSMVACMDRSSSLKEVQDTYVVGLFERSFELSSSFYGKMVRFLHCGLCGGETSTDIMQKTLTKIKKVFQEFFAFIEKKSPNSSQVTEVLCRLTYFPSWQRRICHICALFEIAFPSQTFEIAQRFIASSIVLDMTGVQVPWLLLERILKKEILNENEPRQTPEIRELDTWIGEVRSVGVALSPVILLRVFEEVSIRVYPRGTRDEHEKNSFFIAWKLYKHGFKDLLSKDIFTAAEIKETLQSQYSLKIGEELLFDFPLDLQLRAFSLPEDPSRMLVTSLAPLALGIWCQNEVHEKNSLPLLQVFEHGTQFQFIIVDRLVGTFQDTIWEKPGVQTNNDKMLADSLVALVTRILSFKKTPELNTGQFFIAVNRKIYVLKKTIEKFKWFSIQYVEDFVRRACQGDRERMAYVMKYSMFHENEYACFFNKVLERACTSDLIIAPQEIKRSCVVYNMLDPNLNLCVKQWNEKLSQHVGKAFALIGNNKVPSSCLIEAVAAVQREEGFVTIIPDDLYQKIAKHIQMRPQGKRSGFLGFFF